MLMCYDMLNDVGISYQKIIMTIIMITTLKKKMKNLKWINYQYHIEKSSMILGAGLLLM